jgi:hypothetical protein
MAMTAYTITITPEDSTTTTTLRLETTAGEAIVTDVHVHAGEGLPAGRTPDIDYRMLLRAVSRTAPTTAAGPAAQAVPQAAKPSRKTPAPAVEATAARRRPAAQATARKAAPTAKSRTAEAETTTAAATAGRARRPSGRAATSRVAQKAAGGGAATPSRAYRRMPDDLATVYRRAGSTSTVAEHYQVPRHTVNGWLRRLREQGAIPAGR